MDILISIIIPVYNSENYISKCIESIINSYTLNDLETIIVDDGSKDNSYSIVKKYQNKDTRIKLIKQDNKGPSAARNKGLNISKGKYIMFVDSDDYLHENTLFYFRELLLSGKYDTIMFNYSRTNEENKIQKNTPLFCDNYEYGIDSKNRIYETLVSHHKLNHPVAKFYSNELIQKHDIRFEESLRVGEDRVFNMEYFYYSKKGFYKDVYFYYYRKNTQSLTKNFNISRYYDLVKTHKIREKYIEKYNLSDDVADKAYLFTLNSLLVLIELGVEKKASQSELDQIINSSFFLYILNKCNKINKRQKLKVKLTKCSRSKIVRGIFRLVRYIRDCQIDDL